MNPNGYGRKEDDGGGALSRAQEERRLSKRPVEVFHKTQANKYNAHSPLIFLLNFFCHCCFIFERV